MAGSRRIFREQDIARIECESSVLRFEMQGTAQGNNQLSPGIRMPPALRILFRFLKRCEADREPRAERVPSCPGFELDEPFPKMRLSVCPGPQLHAPDHRIHSRQPAGVLIARAALASAT